ncbi:MAG TPA: alpha/beta fold hydrolase [Acidimicrobiales bacterium]|nr:alpha/beta fold hydrolase [Acidimicrobiales bacterium]
MGDDRSSDDGQASVLLVHGGSHDGWCWHLVQAELASLGVASVAPDLPFTTVADDVATVRGAIDEAPGEVVLVGHSRGGRVITMAAAGSDKVRRLVYVAAQMLPEGATRAPHHRPTPAALSLAEIDGLPPLEAARDAYYHDCPEDLVREAVARLRVVPAGAKGAASSAPAAWRTIPSAYVVCTDDHMIHPDDQRDMARQAGDVFELPSSHSPFFSHPAELAEIIAAYARR